MKTRYYYFRLRYDLGRYDLTAYSLSYAITNRKFASSSDEAWERLRDEYSQDNPSRQYIPEAEGVIEALPEEAAEKIEKLLRNNPNGDFSAYSADELAEMAERRTRLRYDLGRYDLLDWDIIKTTDGYARYSHTDHDFHNYFTDRKIPENQIKYESWQITRYDWDNGGWSDDE